MKVCPQCGYREAVAWRHSRFDYNADYMRFDEATRILNLKQICEQLKNKGNFDRIIEGSYSYYHRGTGGLYLYRVLNEDFKVRRERKKHVYADNQTKLLEVENHG